MIKNLSVTPDLSALEGLSKDGRRVCKPVSAKDAEDISDGERFLNKVREAVCASMSKGRISVVAIAAEMHLTEQSFRRRLYKYSSKGPKAFFSSLQMEKAQRLLTENPNLSVAKIAVMCGFENSSSFCHKFKRIHDCSPTQYREQTTRIVDERS